MSKHFSFKEMSELELSTDEIESRLNEIIKEVEETSSPEELLKLEQETKDIIQYLTIQVLTKDYFKDKNKSKATH